MNQDEDLLITALLAFLILFGSLTCGRAFGQSNYRLLEIDRFSMEYRQHRNYRDAYFPAYETIDGQCTQGAECFRYGASALFDLNLVSINKYSLFWRNDVNMDATNRQVRHVGWKWELGFPLIPDRLEVFTRHYSRHILDDSPQVEQRFPLRDEYVLRMNFLGRGK